MRHRLWLALSVALVVLLARLPAEAAGNCTVFKTWLSNEVLTASDLNNSMIQAATTNSTPACLDDYSATVGQMQTQTDPYPSGTESLPTSLAGELERIRYQLRQLTGRSFWYQTPRPGGTPNLLTNGSVEKYTADAATAPDDWGLTGAGATSAKNSTAGQYKHGSVSVDLTRNGTDAYLAQIPPAVWSGGVAYIQGRSFTASAWVRATVANRARLAINDGVATTFSSYHTGGSAFELLTVTRTLDGAATKLEVRLQVDTGNTTVQFDAVALTEGDRAAGFTPNPVDQPIMARTANSLAISIANATNTAVTFDTALADPFNVHSTSSNPSRLTAPVAGLYLLGCNVVWAGNATGQRALIARVGGTTAIAEVRSLNAGASVTVGQAVATLYRLNPTEYMECVVFQDSGGSLNVNAASQTPAAMMLWVGQ